jgi:hypothetical protein
MMIDQDIVAASPSSVYRVLAGAGLLDRWNKKPSKKGTGFVQPLRTHEHWHIDIAYLNLAETFYYLCSILDGASREIVHWDLRESMTEADVERILLRAHELHPGEKPRVISDHGATVHRQGLQGVQPAHRDDPRPHVAVLPAVERQAGPLPQNHQGRRDSPGPADDPRPGSRDRHPLRRALQPRPLSQRDRLHHACRLPRRARPRSGPSAIGAWPLRARPAPVAVPSSDRRRHEALLWRCSGSLPARTAARGGTRPRCDHGAFIRHAWAPLGPRCPATREERTKWRAHARACPDARPPRGARASPGPHVPSLPPLGHSLAFPLQTVQPSTNSVTFTPEPIHTARVL